MFPEWPSHRRSRVKLHQITKGCQIKRNTTHFQGDNNNSTIGCYRGDPSVQYWDPFYPATSPVPDLDCESDPFSLWFVWLWEEQQCCEPDGFGKRQGASHHPPWDGDPLRRIHWGPADSVSWHRPSVTTPHLAMVMRWCHVGCYTPQGAAFTSNAGQTTESGPPGDLGFIPFQSKPLSKGFTLQWDITDSTTCGTMVVCENDGLRCSYALK